MTLKILLIVLVLYKVSATRCPYPSNGACKNAKLLTDSHRSTQFIASNTARLLCDTWVAEGWYRFQPNGTDVTMPMSCVEPNHCGTVIPIWFQGVLPKVQDGATLGKGCLNHGKGAVLQVIYGGTQCCHEPKDICIQNCGGYYVYRLTRVSGCSTAYCAGNQHVCPYGQYGNGTQCTKDMYPIMNSQPVLENPKCENGDLKFSCKIPYDPTDLQAKLQVVWLVDGKPLSKFGTSQPIIQTLSNGDRITKLDGLNLYGNMGKRLQCRVVSFYSHVGILSGALTSNGIFCGISVTPSDITIPENGGPQTISLTTSIPHCGILGNTYSCEFAVELKAKDNFQYDQSTNGCRYTFKYNNATKLCEAKIKVLATRDFVKDGDKTHILDFRPIETSSTQNAILPWVKHQLSPIQVHTKDKKKGVCTPVTDPHIKSISGRQVNSYVIGDSVLYRTKASCTKIRPLEVHIQANQDCYPSRKRIFACICGIVAKEGNDIVEINGCTHIKNVFFLSKYKQLNDGTTFHTDVGGRKFYINFPSGARLTVSIDVVNNLLSPINLEIPSDHQNCAEGLCGSFDGKYIDRHGKDWANDSKAVSYDQFPKSWFIPKPQSMFYNKSTVIDQRYSKGHEYCQCLQNVTSCSGSAKNPLTPVFNGNKGLPLLPPKKQTNGKRSFKTETQRTEDNIRKRSILTWPTQSGKTLSYAINVCRKAFQKASLYPHCRENVDDYTVLLDSCTEDIKITDSLTFLDNFVLVYNEACQITIAGDIKYYVTGKNGQLVLPDYVTSDICPSECSMKGKCNKSQCICNSGYHGPDCSVKVGSVPLIHFVYGEDDVDSLCDIRQEDCRTAYVIADNLMYSPDLQCRIRYLKMENGKLVDDKGKGDILVKGMFTSFNELECPLPPSGVSNGAVVGGFKISITTDGQQYSNAETLIIFDSLCQACNEVGNCTMKSNICQIDNKCIRKGEQNSKQQICNPSVSQNSWTIDQRVQEIDHFTASLTGCLCVDDPGAFTCACCQNAGCPCASKSPHQCVDCTHTDECGKYPDIFDI
ncbi:von Willebrand factor D and EGF domain-containing protein-like isoform X2 [Mytilus galloprovincialis]|uniref:von Willebrand factor D and EGF domain-containing protein-like isoform X2 n=1 Tax=Mytilus galloprovincialis TaxID=29158 RepID=UPI003F7C4B84